MHELSIAQAVVDIAVRNAGGRKVTRVDLKVGHLRQVVPSALSFSFELVAVGTLVEGAELEMELVPAAGVCRDCGSETQLDNFPIVCGQCGRMDLVIIAGDELTVEALELEEAKHASIVG